MISYEPVTRLTIICRMAVSGKLPLRLYLMGHVISDDYWGAQLPTISTAESADGRLMLRAVKLFGDGALGSWGSALLEPYSDRPETRGMLRSSPEVFKNLIKRFYEDVSAGNTRDRLAANKCIRRAGKWYVD